MRNFNFPCCIFGIFQGFSGDTLGKESTCQGAPPGAGNGNPLGILAWNIPWWQETGGLYVVHGAAKSWTWLSTHSCSAGDPCLIPGLGRSPGEGKGYPLQHSGLENSMNYIGHGDAKSQTWLSQKHTWIWDVCLYLYTILWKIIFYKHINYVYNL